MILGDLRLQFHFSIFLQKTTFFSPYKMRFSIEIQNEPKMFFHSLPAAEKVTGLNRKTIQDVLERGNKVYHRKSDHKLFTISKEEPILVAKIEGEDFFSLEEIHEKLGLSPTRFLNQIKSGKFAKKIDWISDELFPGNESETEKPDEIKILREEMRSQFEKYQEEMRSQFEKYQTEISKFQAEIDRLSAKVETLEKEKASALSQRSFALRRSQGRKQSQKFSILPELLTRYLSILNLWRSSSEMGLLTYALMDPKLTDMFSLTTKENIFLIW